MNFERHLNDELVLLQFGLTAFKTILKSGRSETLEAEREYFRTVLKEALEFMEEHDKDDNNKPSPEGE